LPAWTLRSCIKKLAYSRGMDLVRQQPWLSGNFMRWAPLIWLPPMGGYLLWVSASSNRVIDAPLAPPDIRRAS